MKRYKNLFDSVCSFENLHAAAKKALKGKRGMRPGSSFFAEMEEELIALQEELRSGTYRHGGYHYFQIHEPKKRTVAAAEFRDRVVHHAIIRVIEPLFERRRLRLEIHPDKYRLIRCECGVDFCGFVVFGNGRIRVRQATARRFHKRFKQTLQAVNDRTVESACLSRSVTAWVGHVKHAQSWNLRKAVLCN